MMNQEPLGLSWPSDFEDILPELLREWGVKGQVYLQRSLGGGRSGALVYAVDISMEGYTGQAILKLEKVDSSRNQEKLESARHAAAVKDAPEFAETHLPRVIASLTYKNTLALLSTIAGKGLEYATTWEEGRFDQRLASIELVSHSILEDWNADYTLTEGAVPPRDLLATWLERRILRDGGSRAYKFVEETCNIPKDTPSIFFDGRWFPNPLAFFENVVELPDRLHLRAVIGHCHGDMNGRNILVSKPKDDEQSFHLIDLAHYHSEQYLFYDHAYFELSLLLTSRGKCTPRQWDALITHLHRGPQNQERGLQTDDLGLSELIDAARTQMSSWVERHEANRLSFMESQQILARVAAGLNFTHKRISDESRRMAFYYAAVNLKEYIELHQIDWPKSGVEFVIGEMPETALPEHTDVTETAFSEGSLPFDGPEGRAALASIPQTGAQPEHQGKTINVRSRRAHWYAAIALLCVIVIAAGVNFALRDFRQSDRISASQTNLGEIVIPSIAVLPFRDLNNTQDNSFADGLTIETIHVLASTGAFRIPGFTSVFQFRDNPTDLTYIGERLNVEYLVEGTVRELNNTFRIEVHLVRADDGFLVWNGTFRESLGELFIVQEKLAESIGVALSVPLEVDSLQLEAQRTKEPEAYEAFLSGIANLAQGGQGIQRAIEELERAVSLEPEFASAWAALSIAYNAASKFSLSFDDSVFRPAPFFRKSKAATLRAININPNYSIVRHAAANLYQRELQWEEAERQYRGALISDGANHRAMLDFAGLLQTVGRPEAASDFLDRAKALDPFNDNYALMAAWLDWQETGSEAAVEEVERIFLESDGVRDLAFRAYLDQTVQDGDLEPARALIARCETCSDQFYDRAYSLLDSAEIEPIEEIFERYKDDPILSYQFLYAFGGIDAVLEAYQYNGLISWYRLDYFTVPWTLMSEIGSTSGFVNTSEDIGLVDYWNDYGWPERCRQEDASFVCE